MRTKLHENNDWTTCLKPKIVSNPYNVFCEKPTKAKFIEIYLRGYKARLYLAEVSVVKIGEYGLSFYRKI